MAAPYGKISDFSVYVGRTDRKERYALLKA